MTRTLRTWSTVIQTLSIYLSDKVGLVFEQNVEDLVNSDTNYLSIYLSTCLIRLDWWFEQNVEDLVNSDTNYLSIYLSIYLSDKVGLVV